MTLRDVDSIPLSTSSSLPASSKDLCDLPNLLPCARKKMNGVKHAGKKMQSRFRCGCHGLHVDTGRLLPLTQQVPREQRHCVFCVSGSAEDEHQFVFDCPAYCAIRNRFTNIFWGPAPTSSSFFTLHDPKVIVKFLRECFEHRNSLVAAQSGHNLWFSLECISCEH